VLVSVSAARGPRATRSRCRGAAQGVGDCAPLELAPELSHLRLLSQPLLQRHMLREHPGVAASGHPQMQIMVTVPNGHPARHSSQVAAALPS